MPLLRRSAVVAALLMSLAVTTAHAPGALRGSIGPTVLESTELYDIAGSSIPALWQSMGLEGPKVGSSAWAGQARWDVRWSLEWRAEARACHIEKVSTSVAITSTLPRWPGREFADAELRSKWDRFLAALELHEAGHGANGRRAALRIQAALLLLGSRPGCEALSLAAHEAVQQIVDDEAANDRAYDAATRHGLTQGVVLN